MIMTRSYFEANVDKAVEIEYEDGGRFWERVKGEEGVKKLCNKIAKEEGVYLSDIDLCCRQTDSKVRHFLNLIEYNCYHNPLYKNKGFYEVLDEALDNWDYKE